MTSFKKGASKLKHLRRATWFYKEKGIWLPYDTPVCSVLESRWQKGEFKQPVLIPPEKEKEFVEFKNGTFTQFKQNRPQMNKEAQRGWNAQVLESVTETTSIITTLTRDGIIVGPGSPPFTKTLQPGAPFPTLPHHANPMNNPADIQYVPQTNGYPQPANGNFQTVPAISGYPQGPSNGNYQTVPMNGGYQQAPPNGNYQTVPMNGAYQQVSPNGNMAVMPHSLPNGAVYYPGDGAHQPQVQMMAPPGYKY